MNISLYRAIINSVRDPATDRSVHGNPWTANSGTCATAWISLPSSMARLTQISTILLLGSLLAVFIPLASSFHHHPGSGPNRAPDGVSVSGHPDGWTSDSRCDLCARLLLTIVWEPTSTSTLLPDFQDIPFVQREIPTSSHLLPRLKDRSPPPPSPLIFV